ncbi:MAG: site-specific DNA-methyltransferase [Pseudomonadota bacterium]
MGDSKEIRKLAALLGRLLRCHDAGVDLRPWRRDLRALLDGDLAACAPAVHAHLHTFFGRCHDGSGYVTRTPSPDDREVALRWPHQGQHHLRHTHPSRDRFLHPDLGAHLSRELDRYLQAEVLDLDALAAMGEEEARRALALAQAVRAAARPIITILASLEGRHRRLILEPRVLRSAWCVTLDRVPPALYPAIAANERQVRRWRELFAIEELEGGQGATVSEAFLARHPGLVVETTCWDDGGRFEARLLAALGEGLEHQVTALLVRGENGAALRLLGPRLAGAVGLVYIDPPYNTGGSGLPYEDASPHPAWLTSLAERLELARALLPPRGALLCSIDEHEAWRARALLEAAFGPENVLTPFVWKRKAGGGDDSRHVVEEHEYVLVAARSAGQLALNRIAHESPAMTAKYNKVEGGRRYYLERLDKTSLTYSASMDYGIAAPDGSVVFPPQPDPERHTTSWRWSEATVRRRRDELVFQRDREGAWRVYTRTWAPDERGVTPRSLLVDQQFGRNRDGTRELAAILGSKVFRNPKPLRLMSHLLEVALPAEPGLSCVLDFYAGSGSTGHAVLGLNRADGGARRFVLVEANDTFDTVLLPRILRATYSRSWRGGRPVDRAPLVGGALYQVLYLESWEDRLAGVAPSPAPGDR